MKPKGRLKQGVTQGVFRGTKMTLDEMCREAAKLGIYGFDLINPKDWPTLKKYGLVPTMTPPPFANGSAARRDAGIACRPKRNGNTRAGREPPR